METPTCYPAIKGDNSFDLQFACLYGQKYSENTLENTVKPLLRGHPGEGQKVAA